MAMLGLREFEEALQRVAYQADGASRDAIAKTAALAESGAKKSFEGSHRRGEAHVGGDLPNVVTGTLRRSIRTDPIRRYALGDYGTIVAPRAAYARRVEFGYPGGGPGPGQQATRAFPFFTKPAELAASKFRDVAAETWSRFLNR